MSETVNESNRANLFVSKLLTPDRIELNLRGSNRDSVLSELVNKIPEIAASPAAWQTLLRALQEREQLCSTGIGDGVALPHARNALVGLVSHPVLIFGRHNAGIAYSAIDNAPAKLFFLLVAPNVSLHLQILARLSRMLRDARLRQNLLVAERPEHVVTLLQAEEAKI